jgi:NADPH-dependent 2,4-dienoyl-CoA reductase/sulfur reductase-like enzyme
MTRKRIAIAGTNFAGYTAALELKELVGDNHDIVVVANTHKFLFFPSLIWYPFGLREEEDITFDVRPIYQSHGIEFIEDEIERFDPPNNQILTKTRGAVPYDFLLIGTGPKVDYDNTPIPSSDSARRSGRAKRGTGSSSIQARPSSLPPRVQRVSAPPTSSCSTCVIRWRSTSSPTRRPSPTSPRSPSPRTSASAASATRRRCASGCSGTTASMCD